MVAAAVGDDDTLDPAMGGSTRFIDLPPLLYFFLLLRFFRSNSRKALWSVIFDISSSLQSFATIKVVGYGIRCVVLVFVVFVPVPFLLLLTGGCLRVLCPFLSSMLLLLFNFDFRCLKEDAVVLLLLPFFLCCFVLSLW